MQEDSYLPADIAVNISGKEYQKKTYRTLAGLEPYTGIWGTNEVIQLLKRTMFGSKKEDISYFKKRALPEIVEELLTPVTYPSSEPLNDYDRFGNTVPFGKPWVMAPNVTEENEGRMKSFGKWTMEIFINQDRSINEKMMLFWHNHFATQTNAARSDLLWKHHSLLRRNAIGNFKALTRNITLDCHMLRYLNGEENTRLAPNENYARELQELFCIGKGQNARFTEEDVKQAAKVLTGWKIPEDSARSYFKPEDHDVSDKRFSSFYDNTVIKGRAGEVGGEQELDDLMNMIFSNKETALFICRKIYRWFVYYMIDEMTEAKVIEPLADILRKYDHDIKPVLAALFGSAHFFDPANRAVQIKSPIDLCIGMHREFNVRFSPQHEFVSNYSMLTLIIEYCLKMGQVYTDPPNVSGWAAYYQVPGFYELWINTSSYPVRNEFSSTFIDYGFNRVGHFYNVDVIAFAASLSDPGDPDALINESLEILYRIPISDESKKELKKNSLLSGQMQDHYWTDAWKEYIAAPGNNELKLVVETRLKNLYRYIVNSAEYQLA